MKTKPLVVALLSATTLMIAASGAFAQPPKSQAGGLPALADEVAALRAMVEDLQGQIGANDEPYKGTYQVTIIENALFGCRPANNPPTPSYLPNYFLPLNGSSISVRSAEFEVEADGAVLTFPVFSMLTQELRLSGYLEGGTEVEDLEEDVSLIIGGDGSFTDTVDESLIKGQFSDDGSMFSALISGSIPSTSPTTCSESWTAHVTGVRK